MPSALPIDSTDGSWRYPIQQKNAWATSSVLQFRPWRYRGMTGYTSLEGYLAHWRALQREQQKNPASPKSPVLEEMKHVVQEILGEEARYLQEDPADSAARRHRDRAETRLRRELIARGTISE